MGNTVESMTQYEADNYNNPDVFTYLVGDKKPSHTLPPPIPEEELERDKTLEVPVYDPNTFNIYNIPPEDRHSTLKYGQFKRETLLNHNFARRNARLPDLQWSDKASTRAKNRVNSIINKENCVVTPRGRKQNVYQSMKKPVNMYDAVQSWHQECNYYDPTKKNPTNFDDVRQFTQLAWQRNKGVGCHEGQCGDKHFLVCDYDRGNYKNQFRRNVSTTACPKIF